MKSHIRIEYSLIKYKNHDGKFIEFMLKQRLSTQGYDIPGDDDTGGHRLYRHKTHLYPIIY